LKCLYFDLGPTIFTGIIDKVTWQLHQVTLITGKDSAIELNVEL